MRAVNNPSIRLEAASILRSMIERITVTPDEKAPAGIRVEVQGGLAAILAAESVRRRLLKQKDPVPKRGPFASGCCGALLQTEAHP
jgi:hypothetical protein